MQALKVALMGAGGKMGCRIADNVKDLDRYDVSYVEVSPEGRARLAERGIAPAPDAAALADADAVILALPDRLIATITERIVPQLKAGAMVVGLDPAAAYAGVIPIRDDLTYFVTHPCHPPLFHDETRPEAMRDWFGGIHAKQHIVCALHHGPESDYAKGEQLARDIYAPVMNAYRVTVEQMAILEPAMAETFAATLVTALKEALDGVVAMGVPEDAAREFLLGHLRIEVAIVFGIAGFPFSDGAKLAIAQAYEKIFKPDWKEKVLDLSALRESVNAITGQQPAVASPSHA
jgi:D-apionate oxidoisomerase